MEKKQHPLDRLFGEKLRDHEVTPPAWEKIQSRLPPPAAPRTRPLWVRWAVAASVAALIGAGFWIGQGYLPAPGQSELADESSLGKSPTQPLTSSNDTALPTARVASTPGPQKLDLANVERRQLNRYPSVGKNKNSSTQVPGVRQPSSNPESIRPVSPETPVPIEPSAPPQQLALLEKTPTAPAKVPETTASVFVLHVTEPPVLVEALGQPEEQGTPLETGKPKKGKFLNRMVKNLKHLKQGEWKEAGLDANGLLARAEDKLLHK